MWFPITSKTVCFKLSSKTISLIVSLSLVLPWEWNSCSIFCYKKKTMSSYAVRRIGSSLKIKNDFSVFHVLIRMLGHQFWGLCSVHVVSLWDLDGWMWHPRAPIVVLGSSRERKSFVWFIVNLVFAKIVAKIQRFSRKMEQKSNILLIICANKIIMFTTPAPWL